MVEDMKNVMDEPEQGCIVQADDPHILNAAFDEANAPLTLSSNNSWYWTSMLKLMEQGAAPPNNNAYGGGFHPAPTHTLVPASYAASPSSSSVHDQPFDSMLANSNAIDASDPDSLVWSQDILSGAICESKSSNLHHLTCSDDGLHELLYPRTVLELLFSDQLKLEQLPSWPDFLQQTAHGGMPGKSFGFPLPGLDKLATVPLGALHNDNSENNQLDVKIPAYLNSVFSHLDDRLSSSTASSTLSDNTIDQWAPPNVGTQCEHAPQGPPTATMLQAHASPLPCLQQMDHTLVKQEYPHALSPPYTNGDQYSKLSAPYVHQNQRLIPNPAGNAMNEAIFNEFEQKPALMNKLWSSTLLPDDPLNHRHHIYESTTAANFSHNLRQGALDAANAFHNVSDKHAPAGTESVDRSSRASSSTAPASLRLIHQSSQQIGKKSRSFEGAGTGRVDDITGKESISRSTAAEVLDTKAKGSVHVLSPGTNASSPKHQQQQLSGAEYHFKRPRVDQTPTSSFKNPPIRKEKLGERITTLQQLVSPFGKTDTASVLLEAIGYIKFLQEQVQALSSPYFKSSATLSEDESKPNLRSRGLCLVPLSCTMQVANDNGADYWYGGAFR